MPARRENERKAGRENRMKKAKPTAIQTHDTMKKRPKNEEN